MVWQIYSRGVYETSLEILVAMVTKLYSNSISAVVCKEYHALEIFILHIGANFEKLVKTKSFSNK